MDMAASQNTAALMEGFMNKMFQNKSSSKLRSLTLNWAVVIRMPLDEYSERLVTSPRGSQERHDFAEDLGFELDIIDERKGPYLAAFSLRADRFIQRVVSDPSEVGLLMPLSMTLTVDGNKGLANLESNLKARASYPGYPDFFKVQFLRDYKF